MEGKILLILVIIGICLFLVGRFYNKFKVPRANVLTMITGGVKTGKTTFAVYATMRNHKRNLRRVKFANFFRRLLKMDELEEPKIYSNIPLAVPYVPLSTDLILRKKRFNYGSTVLISEASLVSNSQDIKDGVRNRQMLEFFKLCGHELKGGQIICDTQNFFDVHYALKRSLSEYFYIYKLVKLPFFCVAYVREERYCEDGNVVNTYNEDVEASLKKVLIPKSTWKKFDCYCYSAITDDLPIENCEVIGEKLNLKLKDYVSFMPKVKTMEVKKNDDETKSPLQAGKNDVDTKIQSK